MVELLKQQNSIVTNNSRVLKYFISYVDSKQQQIDELGFRLIESLPNLLKFKYANLAQFTLNRLNPQKIINMKSLILAHQKDRINRISDIMISNFTNKLYLSSSLLESLDYNKVLKRGFAIVQSGNGDFVPSKATTSKYDKFNIRFFDGEIVVKKF